MIQGCNRRSKRSNNRSQLVFPSPYLYIYILVALSSLSAHNDKNNNNDNNNDMEKLVLRDNPWTSRGENHRVNPMQNQGSFKSMLFKTRSEQSIAL